MVPDPEPPMFPFARMVKVCPTWPAPVAGDWVGGSETNKATRFALQPEQLSAWPGTNGRSPAAMPPVIVISAPLHVAAWLAA